jgi:ribosomal protein L11 methylase PrmA
MSDERGIRVRVIASTQAALFLTPSLVGIAGRGVLIRTEGDGLWTLEVWLPARRWVPSAARRLGALCHRLSRYFADPLPPALDWEDQVRPQRLPKGEIRFFRPFPATEHIWVTPSQERMRNAQRAVRSGCDQWGPLVLDIGRARGTGIHPATRICLRLLEAVAAEEIPIRALDVGTGTGILALAAARMGVPKVLAIDVNPQAVRVTRGNVHRNALVNCIKVRCRDVAQEGGRYPLVLANLSAKVILRKWRALIHSVAPGGWLILGGMWWRRLDEVLEEFRPPFEVVLKEREAWWGGALLKRE